MRAKFSFEMDERRVEANFGKTLRDDAMRALSRLGSTALHSRNSGPIGPGRTQTLDVCCSRRTTHHRVAMWHLLVFNLRPWCALRPKFRKFQQYLWTLIGSDTQRRDAQAQARFSRNLMCYSRGGRRRRQRFRCVPRKRRFQERLC